jgi:penicillin amidase
MRKLKRVLWALAALLLLSVAAVAIYLQTTKPDYSGELNLERLSAPVTVYHDDFGIPHIYGNNETDVYRAFGYLVARERLFQMELIRRVSSGRLSEILGGSMLDVDRFFRMLDINAHADSSVKTFFSSTDLPYQQATLAYLDGINQYIETGNTPLEFRLIGIRKERYTLRDLYLIVDYMAFNFQMGFRTDPLLTRIDRKLGSGYLDQLTLGYTSDQLRNAVHSDASAATSARPAFASIIEQLPVRIWTGSNAFAIAPSRSASGKTLLENDTHIGQQQPGVWFDAHLNYPGVNFYGSYLAGFPFAPIGHTPAFGWGVTMLENDDVDFFAERTVAGDSNSVIIRNRPKDVASQGDHPGQGQLGGNDRLPKHRPRPRLQ